MEGIIIPIIDFEDTSVEEAIDFLRLRSFELDPDADPTRKGISFVVRKPRGEVAALDEDAAGGLGVREVPGALRIKELRMRNVSLWDALHRVADETGLRVEISDRGILLRPK
ncbi:STN domain-containing protein [Luteolibacter sp. Populi]|uniref:STN domain-containing protein n=1 Tax=Luteolibacter sp. Populi TaxID=3230487 RepID=UPI003467B9D0